MNAPAEPMRGDVVRSSSSLALPQPGPGGLMDPARQWAARGLTMIDGLAVDDDGRTYGYLRGSAATTREITAEWLATWATTTLPAWQTRGMGPEDWRRVVDLLAGKVRARAAAEAAATTPDARRAAAVAHERARATRLAELERQAAEATAAVAAYAAEPAEVEPGRRGGWLRRSPAP